MKFSFRKKKLNSILIPKYLGFFGLLVIIFYFLNNLIDVRFIQDDAYTSFRYAKNFAEGNGLVFNTGERVEGYTNFLWVMILTLFYLLDHAHILTLNLTLETVSQILSIIFSVCVLVMTYVLSRTIYKLEEGQNSFFGKALDELFNLIPVSMLSLSTPLIYWAISAMETTLFVSLTLLSILFYIKNGGKNNSNRWWIFTSVLNSLLRPEGVIVFALIISHKILYGIIYSNEQNINLRIRNAFNRILAKEILLFSFPLFIYLSFRLIYYGYPLPNTFYAKTDFSFEFILRGIKYFLDFASAYLLYGFVLCLPLILLLDKKNIRKHSFLLWFVFSWTILMILIGGDVLPIHRFFLPVMPLIFILFVRAIPYSFDLIIPRKKWISKLISLTAAAVVIIISTKNYSKQKIQMMEKYSYESGLVKKMKIYAGWIENRNESKSMSKIKVAMSTIGSFSYFSNARVIDIVGLTDEYISHHPKEVDGIDDELPVLWKERHYNAEYVLSQKPDYIIFPAGAKPSAFAECALFLQPEFRENYYTQIFYSDELRQFLPIFTLKRNSQINLSSVNCNNKYLKHYIEANNCFLEMVRKKDRSILPIVIDECDSVIQLCPQMNSDVNTLKGLTFYHTGEYKTAQKYLLIAAAEDCTNSIARYYLMKIFISQKNEPEGMKMIKEIIRYSPDAFPNLVK